MTAVTEALDRAIASLNADRDMIDKLGVMSPELEADIAILVQLRDEFAAGPRAYRERLASHTADLGAAVDLGAVERLEALARRNAS